MKIIKIIASIICLAALAVFLRNYCGPLDTLVSGVESLFAGGEEKVSNEGGQITIESISSKSDLYVAEESVEDMKLEVKETGLFGKNKHKWVQVERRLCTYKVSLDKVTFCVIDSISTIYVVLPKLVYEDFFEDSKNFCDNKDEWLTFDNKPLKEKVQASIQKRFRSPANRLKAIDSAQTTISNLLKGLYGNEYEIIFESSLERHIETKVEGNGTLDS